MDELTRRAFAAYFRSDGESADMPSSPAAMVTHEGKTYVVLENSYRALAVYRVRTSGQLKRLRRWPAAVEQQ
jgi:hypothetical protein